MSDELPQTEDEKVERLAQAIEDYENAQPSGAFDVHEDNKGKARAILAVLPLVGYGRVEDALQLIRERFDDAVIDDRVIPEFENAHIWNSGYKAGLAQASDDIRNFAQQRAWEADS